MTELKELAHLKLVSIILNEAGCPIASELIDDLVKKALFYIIQRQFGFPLTPERYCL